MLKKLLLTLLLFFLTTGIGSAIVEVNKNLSLVSGYSYLLSFDEKIIRYKQGDDKAVYVEPLSSIYSDRHEVLVKPVKNMNTNLIIWTSKGVYNFNIFVNPNSASKEYYQTQNSQNINVAKKPSSVIQTFINKADSQEIDAALGELELDNPPYLSGSDNDVFTFKLDKPPVEK